MRIVIATPLFPPDIAEPAPYVKELAARLATQHEVTVVMYGQYPEHVENVTFACIDKKSILAMRLMRYLLLLYKEAKQADIVFAQNGASVELPVGIIAYTTNVPFILHLNDARALARAKKSLILSLIQSFAIREAKVTVAKGGQNAKRIMVNDPQQKPEILPFVPYPTTTFSEYETTWETHIRQLLQIFEHEK